MAGSGKPVSQIRGARFPEKPVQQQYGSRKAIPKRGDHYPSHKWDRSAAGIGGCVHVRSSTLIIPAHCVKVSIRSFTQPCLQRMDGKLLCNGVVITASLHPLSRPETALCRHEGINSPPGWAC